MSYSRWSNSCWYTFWCSMPTNSGMEDQLFEICCVARPHHFSYKDLKENIDGCLQKVKDLDNKEVKGKILKDFAKGEYDDVTYPPQPHTEEEYKELMGYMERFIEDVEKSYTETDNA